MSQKRKEPDVDDEDLVWEDIVGYQEDEEFQQHIRLVLNLPDSNQNGSQTKKNTNSQNEEKVPLSLLKQIQRTHVLSLLARSSFIEYCLDDNGIQSRMISLVPDNIINQSNVRIMDEEQMDGFHAIISWFQSQFTVRNATMKDLGSAEDEANQRCTCVDSIFAQLLQRIDSKEGEMDLLVGLFVSLIRALGHRCRFVRLLDIAGSRKKQRVQGSVKQKSRRRSSSAADQINTAQQSTAYNCNNNFNQYSYKKDNDVSYTTCWCEIYCGSADEGKWIHVDPFMGWINRPHVIDGKSLDVRYVVGIYGGHLQDITLRYSTDYLKALRRRDEEWFQQTLVLTNLAVSDYLSNQRQVSMDADRALLVMREESELRQCMQAQSKGFPTTIEGFKSHPLYILQRHIGKTQMMEPGSKPVGLHKGECFYQRAAVCKVRSTAGWARIGRQVLQEQIENPAKTRTVNEAKSRSKFKPGTSSVLAEEEGIFGLATAQHQDQNIKTINLYGYWQTQVWQAPIAVDGKVPQNEFGNVECPPLVPSLPIGTKHLQYPKIAVTCRKLGVHYAHAVTRFDYRGAKADPVVEGVVVCDEFADMVLQAYLQERAELRQRELDKKRKLADRQWKVLLEAVWTRIQLEDQSNYYSNSEINKGIENQENQRLYTSQQKVVNVEDQAVRMNLDVEDI